MIDKTKINEYTAPSGESPSDRLTRSQLKELGGHVWQLYEAMWGANGNEFLTRGDFVALDYDNIDLHEAVTHLGLNDMQLTGISDFIDEDLRNADWESYLLEEDDSEDNKKDDAPLVSDPLCGLSSADSFSSGFSR